MKNHDGKRICVLYRKKGVLVHKLVVHDDKII